MVLSTHLVGRPVVHQGHEFGGMDHRTASETGLARTRGVVTEAHILVLVCLCVLTPLFCVLPYGFMTPPPSGQGGPVTQMIPLLYPSSLYQPL